MAQENRQWRLRRYPEGMPKLEDWELVSGPVPVAEPGTLLARSRFLDVAPYMRARVAPQKNYAAGVEPGQVMLGGAVAEVVASEVADYRPGDLVVTDFGFGWQDYALLKPGDVRRVDRELAPPEAWLDVLGLNGATAWFALFDAGRVKPGDIVLVSAAAGSVGQITGQLAKAAGARTIAVASSADKLAWCRELGFDDGIAWRETPDMVAAIREHAPKGVDLFIDNTAGPIHDAVVQNLAPFARIVLVGVVSLADKVGQPDIGPRFFRQLLIARATLKGFLATDYLARWPEAWGRLADLMQLGELRTRYDIAEGLERTPEAFLRVLTSQNLGKQLVRVA